jgi:hypothetical protein
MQTSATALPRSVCYSMQTTGCDWVGFRCTPKLKLPSILLHRSKRHVPATCTHPGLLVPALRQRASRKVDYAKRGSEWHYRTFGGCQPPAYASKITVCSIRRARDARRHILAPWAATDSHAHARVCMGARSTPRDHPRRSCTAYHATDGLVECGAALSHVPKACVYTWTRTRCSTQAARVPARPHARPHARTPDEPLRPHARAPRSASSIT